MTGPTIGFLGADKQAAVSAALAWPEKQFLFVTDSPVADGWDLPNVRFLAGSPKGIRPWLRRPGVLWVPLCGRWATPELAQPVNLLSSHSLSRTLPFLGTLFADVVLPVSSTPMSGTKQIIKGNAWHRPDATLVSDDFAAQHVTDPYDCGLLYQPYWSWKRLLVATGWRTRDSVALAVVHILSEVCARDDVIGAGQTIHQPRIAELTVSMLEALGHTGFFTLNWLERDEEVRLSSLRPIPRALFRTFRRAGFDPFAPNGHRGIHLAPANLKFVVDITYTSYQPLAS